MRSGWLRASATVAAAAVFTACQGRATSDENRLGDGSGGAAGNNGVSGGSSAGGAAAGGVGSGVAGQNDPAGGKAGSAGSGNGGWSTSIPGATERDKEWLGPLGTEDQTIAESKGTELTALAASIGKARGYAMCRCLGTVELPVSDGCAITESGISPLDSPDPLLCINETMTGVPGFEEYLGCRSRWLREDGRAWEAACSNPQAEHTYPSFTCTLSPEVSAFLDSCRFAQYYYCADGTRVSGARCDQLISCPDSSDERGCLAEIGRDWFLCHGTIPVYPAGVCVARECHYNEATFVCDADRPGEYLCGDGGSVGLDTVCDRVSHCEDGSDEMYCLR